jgi:hypothetical protein
MQLRQDQYSPLLRSLLTVLFICASTSSGAIAPARPQLFGHFFTTTGPGEVEVRVSESELPQIMKMIGAGLPTLCDYDQEDLRIAMRKAEGTIWPEFVDPAIASAPKIFHDVVEDRKTFKFYKVTLNVPGVSKITFVSDKTGQRLGWATLTYRDRTVQADNAVRRELSCAFDEYPADVSDLDRQVRIVFAGRLEVEPNPPSTWWRSWTLKPIPDSLARRRAPVHLTLGGDPSTKLGHADLSVYEIQTAVEIARTK